MKVSDFLWFWFLIETYLTCKFQLERRELLAAKWDLRFSHHGNSCHLLPLLWYLYVFVVEVIQITGRGHGQDIVLPLCHHPILWWGVGKGKERHGLWLGASVVGGVVGVGYCHVVSGQVLVKGLHVTRGSPDWQLKPFGPSCSSRVGVENWRHKKVKIMGWNMNNLLKITR